MWFAHRPRHDAWARDRRDSPCGVSLIFRGTASLNAPRVARGSRASDACPSPARLVARRGPGSGAPPPHERRSAPPLWSQPGSSRFRRQWFARRGKSRCTTELSLEVLHRADPHDPPDPPSHAIPGQVRSDSVFRPSPRLTAVSDANAAVKAWRLPPRCPSPPATGHRHPGAGASPIDGCCSISPL